MDFMTPEGSPPVLPGFASRPTDESPETGSITAATDKPPENRPETGSASRRPNSPELGDLESAPGLAEYAEHASKGARYLINLATELELQGEFRRALLAWERVIDSCDPSTEERRSAESSVLRLRPTLPRWSIDPTEQTEILLQFGTTRSPNEGIATAAQEVADFLRRDSDDLCAVTPRLTTAKPPNRSLGGPVAIYLTGTGPAEDNQSTVLSINPDSNERQTIRREVLTALYKILRERLTGQEGIRPPLPPDHPDRPEEDFRRYLTRLHWKLAAESLAEPPVGQPESAPDPLPDGEPPPET